MMYVDNSYVSLLVENGDEVGVGDIIYDWAADSGYEIEEAQIVQEGRDVDVYIEYNPNGTPPNVQEAGLGALALMIEKSSFGGDYVNIMDEELN